MEKYSSFSLRCILVMNVIRTVIYVEYPPISMDSLLPTRLGRKKMCLIINGLINNFNNF